MTKMMFYSALSALSALWGLRSIRLIVHLTSYNIFANVLTRLPCQVDLLTGALTLLPWILESLPFCFYKLWRLGIRMV